MNIYDCFGYVGQPFELLEKDTIGYLAGNQLCKWNLENNKKEYLPCSRNGFQCFCVNYRHKAMAIAEFGLNPIVHVDIDGVHFELLGVSPLEILQMEFSYCGNYLLVVVGVPKYEICIWDIKERCRVRGKNSQLGLKLQFIEARFSILGERVLIRYERQLVIYQMMVEFEQQGEQIVKNVKLEQVASRELNVGSIMVQDYNLIVDTRSSYEQNNIYLIDGDTVIYLNGESLEEIVRHQCNGVIKHMVVTQKHLIIGYEGARFEWLFKYLEANLKDQFAQPFKLDKKYQHNEKVGISHMIYNQMHTKLFIGMSDASLIILPVAAEGWQGEEDPQGDQQEDEKQVDLALDMDPVKLGPFSKGSIVFIKEFKQYHVVVSGCLSGNIVFWDIITKQPLAQFNVPGQVTCADLVENTVVIGTSSGILRFYNVNDIRNPVLHKIIKLYQDKPITCVQCIDEQVAVSSTESQQVFLFNGDILIGFVELPFNCSSHCWNPIKKQLLLCLSQFLLVGIQVTMLNQSTLKLELPTFGRKIDPDQQLLICNSQGDVITTGKDKVFKKYRIPEEILSKMDLKMKVANQGPIDEHDGHNLAATCLSINGQLYSGAKDGTIMIRSQDKLSNDLRMFKSHNIKYNGVSTICASQKYKMIYTGGMCGTMIWWAGEKIKGESDSAALMKNNYSAPPDVPQQDDCDVMYYQQVLEQEYMLQQAPIREQQKKQTKEIIKQIHQRLYAILDENNKCDELERLDRDEFVIDLVARDSAIELGKKQRNNLRELVKKENIREEIIYTLIKERTWDQIEVPLKGINGLTVNILVYNYHIRIRSNEELRKLKLVRELRRQELKELKLRKQQQVQEVWSLDEQIQDPKYILNAKPGPQQLILTDYEKKEDPAPTKVLAKPGVTGGPQAKQPVANARQAAKLRQQQLLEEQARKEHEEALKREQQQKEEKQKVQESTEEKKEGSEDLTEWDYIYGASELFSTNRKRNQMVLLVDVILNIKKQFNVEFEQTLKLRQSQVDNINERNKRILEINAELKRQPQLIKTQSNQYENPEKVLNVEPSEIPFPKYETKEVRDRKEADRQREEARQKALREDDSGQRALKDMMSGTLEEKKETPLDEVLEMEEWMHKNPDDMSEEERMKLKEFEVKKAKLEEDKEKIRKNLEAELKKLNTEIVELCTRFDERILVLFRRKLEYDYRVLEQELLLVRLALSIITQQQAIIKIKELEQLHTTLSERLQVIKTMKEQLDEIKMEAQGAKQRTQEQIQGFFSAEVKSKQYPTGLDAGKLKILWDYAFEIQRNSEKAKAERDAELLEKPQYKDALITIDPLFEYRKKEINHILNEEFNSYINDLQEKSHNMQGVDFDHVKDFLVSTLSQRFKLKQEMEKQDKECQDLENFCKQFEQELLQFESQLTSSEEDQLGIQQLIAKNKSNIEMIMRFKQGFVEVSQDKPVPNVSEAVLMPREAIDGKNTEIGRQGTKKIDLMEEIKKIKFDVAKSEYELKRRDLIIRDLECKTREVQLLKVKKEMQVALTKDDTRLNEKELKNIEKQMEILKKATEKRFNLTVKKREKIEKDIEFIRKENQQLLGQGASLNGNVKQLQEISDMQNKKGGKQGEEQQEQVQDRFTQISHNHKLFHQAKKQAEEIELLREELSKLKARTFANFANAHH